MTTGERQARRPRVMCVCESCKRSFTVAANAAERGAKYCSRPCYTAGRTGQLRAPLADRFWRRVRKTRGCWLWTGAADAHGYGRIGAEEGGGSGKNKPTRLTHRVSWELHYGPIPHGRGVLHHCDNPACVRPDHLFLGGQDANMRDCSAKDRTTFGEKAVGAKVSARDVATMRALYRDGGVTYRDLGAQFGIAPGTVGNIVRRTNWRRVE